MTANFGEFLRPIGSNSPNPGERPRTTPANPASRLDRCHEAADDASEDGGWSLLPM
jgi:hypothetical protein